LLRKAFTAWREETKTFKIVNRIVDEMFKLKQAEYVGEMFKQWRDRVYESKIEKRNEELAMTFYLKQLMKKILKEWNLFATMKVLKRLEDTHKLQQFVSIRSRLIYREVFTIWSRKTNEQLKFHDKEKKAHDHYDNKLNRKAILVWKDYVKMTKQKKMLVRKADSFLAMRIKTEVYFKWCIKYQMECELQEKNERALLLWSINIQKTCFAAWLAFHQIKKQKKLRYKKALEARQVDILKDCARCFIKYSTDARQRRMLSNFHLKQNIFFDSVTLEAKYFYLWASKCKFRLRNKTETNKNLCASKQCIPVETSLERREKITGCPQVIPNEMAEFSARSRPAPRKPNFLIDSIDTKNIHQSKISTIETTEQEIFLKEKVSSGIEFRNPTILLPPSAFLLPSNNLLADTKHESNVMISASDTTFSKNKGYFRVDFSSIQETHTSNSILNNKECNEANNVPKFDMALNLQPLESPRSENSKLRRHDSASNVANIEKDIELVEIKKRLETLSMKSEKLK
jgi:hypothetical protein